MLFQHNLQAQTDYRKGYIINQKGDTVSGDLNFHDGVKSYEVCDFKAHDNAESIQYLPTDIAGYGFSEGRRYQTKTLTKEFNNQVVFVEIIADGHITLSRYRETFWIQKKGGDFTELQNDLVNKTKDGDLYRVHSNQYIAVINTLMVDCKEVSPLIKRTQFHQKDLVRLVEAYNTCGSEPTENRNVDKRWLKLIPGVTAGVQFSSIDVSDLKTFFNDDLKQIETEIAPVIGINLDICSPRVTERFLFNTGLWYTSSAYYLKGQNPSLTNYVTINIDEIKLPLGVRYTLAPRKVTPYINAGVALSFTVKEQTSWRYESIAANTVYTFDKGSLPLKNSQVGLWGGAGVLVKLSSKLDSSIELRYERTDGIVDTGQLRQYTSHVSNLQLLIALRLNTAQ
jgi:hypothetical protein